MLALGDAVPVKYEFIRVSTAAEFHFRLVPQRPLPRPEAHGPKEQDRLDDMQADLRRMQRRLSSLNSRGFRKGYGW